MIKALLEFKNSEKFNQKNLNIITPCPIFLNGLNLRKHKKKYNNKNKKISKRISCVSGCFWRIKERKKVTILIRQERKRAFMGETIERKEK